MRAADIAGILPGMAEYDMWAPDYDEWAAEMTEDVPFYVELAREAAGDTIVELGVGTGRIAIPIAGRQASALSGRSLAGDEVGRERAETPDRVPRGRLP